ncbi:MAG: hypothetical protein E7057_02485 [Lentisphaerae bacterium]|nr:hypothetical protein [Lentisphaerota bacterium]
MFNWQGKRLLILGATKLIAEIAAEAKRWGAFVAVADYFEDSPAKKIADEALLVDATDVDTLTTYIRENHIDGVLTGFADSLLPAYMELCRRTGLPCYLDDTQLRFTTDKAFFKELCRKCGIPVIREYADGEKMNFPVLIKPVDNSGARGIYICHDEEEFARCRKLALGFSKSGQLLVEDYLNYNEATAFYIFIDGKAHLAALADRHVTPVKEGVIRLPSGYTYPSPGTEKFVAQSHGKFEKLFRELNIRNGIMFLQGFLTDDMDFIPYESGFRVTGSLEFRIFEAECRFNSLAMLINFALTGSMVTEDISEKINPFFPEEAYNISCLMKPGKIAKIEGAEELAALENVKDCFYSYDAGDELPQENWGRLAQIALRVQVTGGKEGYRKVVETMKKSTRILDPDGNELLINKEIVR